MKLAAVVLLASACSQHVYSPPTQAYSLAPVTTLAAGAKAVDLDASSHAQIFDPGISSGTARLRTGIGNDVELSGEGMIASVAKTRASTVANSDIYAGRLGMRVDPGHGPISFTAGLGGGYAPAGGEFVAVDAGLSIGYKNCYVEPIGALSAFVSQPLSATPVDVSTDAMSPTYSTAHRTVGSTVRGGLRIALQHDRCLAGNEVPWITAGFDVTTLVDRSDDAELMGFGVGLTVPL